MGLVDGVGDRKRSVGVTSPKPVEMPPPTPPRWERGAAEGLARLLL